MSVRGVNILIGLALAGSLAAQSMAPPPGGIVTERRFPNRSRRAVPATMLPSTRRCAIVTAPNLAGCEPKRFDSLTRIFEPPYVGLTIRRSD